MKQAKKDHNAGKLHKARSTVKEAAGHVNNNPVLEAKGRSQAGKTSRKARHVAEASPGPAASSRIRAAATQAFRLPADMAAGVARWPKLFANWSKALFSALLRMTENFFSYVGETIRSIRVFPPYKKRSPQVA